ncbi:MAG: hypothetical protein AAF441_25700 [Pseudomonadota bacterium]
MPKTAAGAWVAARAAYSHGVLTITEIAERYGMARSTLYARIKREGWSAPRPTTECGPAGESGRQDPDPSDYVRRLHELLDKTLLELEINLLAGGAKSTPDRERDVRTLASLVRVIEKLGAIEPEQQRRNEAEQTEEDEDLMRAEIADRLARLRRLRDRTVAGPEERAATG